MVEECLKIKSDKIVIPAPNMSLRGWWIYVRYSELDKKTCTTSKLCIPKKYIQHCIIPQQDGTKKVGDLGYFFTSALGQI